MHWKLGGQMEGVNHTRRFTVLAVAVLTLCAGFLSTGAPAAFAADGDPYLDQCFVPAALTSPCGAAGTGIAGAHAIAVHPNQRWVYVGTTGGRILIFDRGARGQLTPRAGAAGCVTATGP